MKQRLKGLLSLWLAIAMLFCGALPALAADDETYTLTFDYNANGDESLEKNISDEYDYDNVNDTVIVSDNGSYTLPNPTRNGHTFNGWEYLIGSGIGETAAGGSTFDNIAQYYTFTAQWTANKNTIVLYKNYDDNGTYASYEDYEYGSDSTATLSTLFTSSTSSTEPTREDHKFLGWSTSSGETTSEDVAFASDDKLDDVVASGTYANGDTINLYAVWAQLYNVTVDENIPNGEVVADPHTAAAGDNVKLTAYPDTGYELSELTSDNVNEFTQVYENQYIYTFTMPASDVEVSATFTKLSYNISLTASPIAGGTVTGEGNYEYDTSHTVTATPNAGYKFVEWKEGSGSVSTDANYTFTVDTNRNLTAVFDEKPSPRPSSGGGTTRYTVKFDTDGGSAIANKTVTRNSKLAEPTAPTKDGYTFDGWYTDKELTTAYDFDSKVIKSFTLYAKWKETDTDSGSSGHNCPSLDFDDLDITQWYHWDIDYVLNNGLMKGIDTDKFAPNDNLTRAMLVTILFRAEGESLPLGGEGRPLAVDEVVTFTDVEKDAYYANAVVWAQQNGIVNGTSETTFAPDDNITREQIAAILYRYAIYKGMDAVVLSENLGFEDADEISEYAISAMNWAVGAGLIKGYEDNTVRPQSNATRAEAAALLQRFIEAN